MTNPAITPAPPYYAVIFTNVHRGVDSDYETTTERMVELAQLQPGFLGLESAREALGITVSYWDSLEAIANWKTQAEHQVAQQRGRSDWYQSYTTRIARVERDYSFGDIPGATTRD